MTSHQNDAAHGRREGQGRFLRFLAGFATACVVVTPLAVMAQSSGTPTHTPPDPSAIQPATPPVEKAPGMLMGTPKVPVPGIAAGVWV